MHPQVAKVQSILDDAGLHDRVRVFDSTTPTAAAAAEKLGCEVGAIANSLVFIADDEPILVLTSGSHRVDTGHLARVIGATNIGRASADQVREATGQVIGGVAPVGHPAPVRTYLDTELQRYDELWAAAGIPASVFSVSYADLRELTDATEVTVA